MRHTEPSFGFHPGAGGGHAWAVSLEAPGHTMGCQATEPMWVLLDMVRAHGSMAPAQLPMESLAAGWPGMGGSPGDLQPRSSSPSFLTDALDGFGRTMQSGWERFFQNLLTQSRFIWASSFRRY